MDGFKDSTKMKYMGGGMVGAYAKGGDVKPAMCKPSTGKAPMKKACGGDVKMPMKKASGGDVKAPVKKNEGGKIGKMPPIGESVKSGNRVSKMTAAAKMREMEERFGEKRRPSPAESAASGNRMSAQEGAEMRGMMRRKTGGLATMPKKGKC